MVTGGVQAVAWDSLMNDMKASCVFPIETYMPVYLRNLPTYMVTFLPLPRVWRQVQAEPNGPLLLLFFGTHSPIISHPFAVHNNLNVIPEQVSRTMTRLAPGKQQFSHLTAADCPWPPSQLPALHSFKRQTFPPTTKLEPTTKHEPPNSSATRQPKSTYLKSSRR